MAFPGDWGRCCKIDIQASLADANLTNYPVLINEDCLPTEILNSSSADKAQADGGDLRFYTGDYTSSAPATEDTDRIPVEIVNWTQGAGGGTCELWVQVPSINSTTGATITVYYNATGKSQPAVGASYGRNAVWDSDYWGVYHMNGSSSTSDETNSEGTSAYDMVQNGSPATSTNGPIGSSRTFDRSNDYFSVTNVNKGSSLDNLTAITVESIVEIDSPSAAYNKNIFTNWNYPNDKGFTLFWSHTWDDFGLEVAYNDTNNTDNVRISESTPSEGTFYFVGGRWKTSEVKGWLSANSHTTSISRTTISDTDCIVSIGAQAGGSNLWDGEMDEVRLSLTDRSDAWMAATYRTCTAPATYAVEGTPVNAPSGTAANLSFSVTETVSLSESLSENMPLGPASISDNVSISELISAIISLDLEVSDDLNISELITTSLGIDLSATDTLNIAEALSVLKDILPNISDTLTISEVLQLLKDIVPSISDSLNIAESVTADVSSVGNITLSVTDALNIAESIVVLKDILPNVFDIIGITELVTLLKDIVPSVSDTLGIVEDVTAAISTGLGINISDTLSIVEALSLLRDIKPEVYDTLTLVEVISLIKDVLPSVIDSFNIDESLTVSLESVGWVSIILTGFDAISGQTVQITGQYKEI